MEDLTRLQQQAVTDCTVSYMMFIQIKLAAITQSVCIIATGRETIVQILSASKRTIAVTGVCVTLIKT